jgi:CheY-like chemotaxis protein
VPRDEDVPAPARSDPALDGTSSASSLENDPHADVTGALHDVSNVLTVLLGWAAEARAGASSPPQLERALSIIEEKAREARDVARRAIGAQTTIDDESASIDEVAGDVLETLSVEASRARVALEVTGHASGARISGAKDLSRILTNLVLNGLAWTPAGSRVTVEIEEDQQDVFIRVRDEGPGIDPQSAPRLFEGRSTRKGGAGIGLRHARALARAAGGDLELLKGEGPGARLQLTWPRLRPPAVGRAPMSSPAMSVLGGRRVLVVEDDRDVATLLEGALEARGAHVVVVRNADELLRAASETYDSALVDLSPIASDVPGALAALRENSPHVELVVISGSALGLPEVLEGAGVRWVRKPFEIGEVVAALLAGTDP